jgi:hypothetical protein
LASRTDTAPRYVEEWLRGQAAGGYVEYDAATGAYRLSPEQAFALTDPDGPIFAPGAFQFALGALKAEPRVLQASAPVRASAGMNTTATSSRATNASSGLGSAVNW